MRFDLLLLVVPLIFFQCSSKQGKAENTVTNEQNLILDTASLSFEAELYYKTQRLPEALEKYSRLIEIDSTNGKFFYRKGYCLVQADRSIEAIEYFKKAADLNFSSYDCFYSLGLIHFVHTDNDSLATYYFEKCLSIKPEASEPKVFLDAIRKDINSTQSSSTLPEVQI